MEVNAVKLWKFGFVRNNSRVLKRNEWIQWINHAKKTSFLENRYLAKVEV